jgi:hypothetical protein
LGCDGCGACCRGSSGTVLLLDADYRRWRAAGRGDLMSSCVPGHFGQEGLAVDDEGDCVHLGPDRSCTIYAIRPDTCRDFEIGSAQCLCARRLFRTGAGALAVP